MLYNLLALIQLLALFSVGSDVWSPNRVSMLSLPLFLFCLAVVLDTDCNLAFLAIVSNDLYNSKS
jgi:hypothetical protein